MFHHSLLFFFSRNLQFNISKILSGNSFSCSARNLELKDKISIDDTLISREIAAGGAEGILTAGSLHIDSEKKKEAVEALVALGYGQAESLKAVNAIEDVEAMDSGAILKAALKKLF